MCTPERNAGKYNKPRQIISGKVINKQVNPNKVVGTLAHPREINGGNVMKKTCVFFFFLGKTKVKKMCDLK